MQLLVENGDDIAKQQVHEAEMNLSPQVEFKMMSFPRLGKQETPPYELTHKPNQ